jgi:hypothetical protein
MSAGQREQLGDPVRSESAGDQAPAVDFCARLCCHRERNANNLALPRAYDQGGMTGPHMPSPEHGQFDTICSSVADFEPLPTVVIESPEKLLESRPPEDEDQPLDGLILAGLVVPY